MRIRTAWILMGVWSACGGQALAQAEQGLAAQASAQQAGTARTTAASRRDPGRAGAFDLSFSALWLSSSSLGSSNANLISNNASGSAYRLFSASGNLDSSVGFEGRAGYHVTRMFAVEGGLTYSRPDITFSVANDAEGAAGFTATGETITQFFADASLVVYPVPGGAAGGKFRPFVEFGAGYLRELHGQTGATAGYVTAETGGVYHAGGGARYYFHARPSGALRAVGLRFDARYYFRNGGFSFDGSHAKTFTAGAGLVLNF